MAIGEHLSDEDFSAGSEGYIRYCAGIAIVQYPDHMADFHMRVVMEELFPEIVGIAKDLMLDGIQRVIHSSNPPDIRDVKSKQEENFESALPSMREIVEWSCERHEERLNKLNPIYTILRPAPFTRKSIYQAVCHRNYQRLSVSKLLDGLVPDVRLITLTDPTNSSD